MQEVSLFTVFIASTITALCTGLGVLPFYFVKDIRPTWVGIGNAVAAGLMLGASIGLTYEGWLFSPSRMMLGLVLGVALILLTRNLLASRAEEASPEHLSGADWSKMLLIIVVMTVHSFAEGIGVGVSYGGGEGFGRLITAAIAIHNIPEGLAIALVMIPRGTTKLKAALWSIFSSLPQPLMAVPAFLFVLFFEPFLPIGLGLAAGAMFYMVFAELLDEAKEHVSVQVVYPVLALAMVGMLSFQFLVG